MSFLAAGGLLTPFPVLRDSRHTVLFAVTLENQRTVRRALIDVGTNSVKLLVADVHASHVDPVIECSEQTRLGCGFYHNMRLTTQSVARTAEAVAQYADKARALGAVHVRVVATSAAREARNTDHLQSAIRESSDIEIEIVSGADEADLAFRGVASDARLAGRPLLVLEVGGGSTQLVMGRLPKPSFRESISVGAVRLLESIGPAEPPCATDLDRCENAVRSLLSRDAAPRLRNALSACAEAPVAVAAGGTASVLASMELGLTEFVRERIESVCFDRSGLRRWVDRLWTLPVAKRREIPGLPPERADVIITGAAIFAGLMDCCELPVLRISTRGLRFGALIDQNAWQVPPRCDVANET